MGLSIMEKDKLDKILEAAKLYYELNYSQQEIAEKLKLSRPTVSRLLHQAKQKGFVQVKIYDPREDDQKLADILEKLFNLKKCLVSSVALYETETIKEKLGEAASEYVYKIVNDGDIIGTSWGTTMEEVAKHLKPKNVKNVTVVQLNGGVSHSETNTYAYDIVNQFGRAFHTTPYFLPLPAVVDHVEVKKTIIADRHISKILNLGKEANIAVYTVGQQANESSTLVQTGYFTEKDLHTLKQSHAVGDICSRYFDNRGIICDESINERTIGIDLTQLTKKKHAILVAGGQEKVLGIYGALQGGYTNTLITDQFTARALIEMHGEEDGDGTK